MHGRIPLYWEILILIFENFPMLQVSVCSCSFLFYPPLVSVRVGGVALCCVAMCSLCVQLVPSL